MRRSTFAPIPVLRNRVNRDAAKAQARLASTLPHSPVVPAAGLFAGGVLLWPGSLLALYFANRASEEPPVSFREMARPVIRVGLAALAAVGPVLIWFVAAAFVSDAGCA